MQPEESRQNPFTGFGLGVEATYIWRGVPVARSCRIGNFHSLRLADERLQRLPLFLYYNGPMEPGLNVLSMKNIITFLLALVMAFTGGAVTFTVDGINYNLLSSKDLTCEVIAGDYSGDIVIPETVSYGNKDITVLNIADNAFYE